MKKYYVLFIFLYIFGCQSFKDSNNSRVSTEKAEMLNKQAYTYIQNNKYQLALSSLNESLSYDDKNLYTLKLRAFVYENLNMFNNAIDDLKHVLEQDTSDSEAYFSIGNNYFALEDYDSAIESYSLSIKFDQLHAGSYLNRANSYVKTNEFKSAIVDYEKYLTLSSNQKEKILIMISNLKDAVNK